MDGSGGVHGGKWVERWKMGKGNENLDRACSCFSQIPFFTAGLMFMILIIITIFSSDSSPLPSLEKVFF
jgi:hypothetical protein